MCQDCIGRVSSIKCGGKGRSIGISFHPWLYGSVVNRSPSEDLER